MAVRFMDGCDHYPNTIEGILWKYDGHLNPMLVREGDGRFGGTNCLGTFSSFGGFVSKQLEPSLSKYHVVGAAIQVDNFITSGTGIMMFTKPGTATLDTDTTWTLVVEDNGVLRVETDGHVSLIGQGTTRITTASAVFTSAVYHFVEVELFIDSVAGYLRLWVDDVTVGEVVGVDTASWFQDTTNPVEDLGLVQPRIWACRFDDIHVLDGSGTVNNVRVGDSRVQVLYPVTNGSNITFSPDQGGTNLGNVNETLGDGSLTTVQTGTVGNKDTYNHTETALGTVFAVQPLALNRKTASNTVTGSVIANNGSADFVAIQKQVTSQFKYLHGVFNTNPETGAIWDATSVNGLEWGYKLISEGDG